MNILDKGSNGVAVSRLQRLLNAILRPQPRLREDGDFGDKTFKAVVEFQKRHGLRPDGVVGPQTWTALGLKIAPATPPALKRPAGTGAWMETARTELELDVQALPGEEHNPKIVDYFDATRYQPGDDETPWCSAFVNWVMKQSGYEGTRSAAAISWLKWGKSLSAPTEGAITVIHYKARDKKIEGCKPMTTGSGNHVAFFVRSAATHIYLLGGNQGRRVSEVGFPLKCWDIERISLATVRDCPSSHFRNLVHALAKPDGIRSNVAGPVNFARGLAPVKVTTSIRGHLIKARHLLERTVVR